MTNEATRALEAIRRTELEAARQVESARNQAEQIEGDARAQGRRLIEEAGQRGEAAARRHLEQVIEASTQRAEEIRSQRESDAETLPQAAAASMELLVERMVALVLEPASEAEGT